MVLQDINTNQKVFQTIEIDLANWDRVSPIIISGSGSGTSNTDAGFGSIMEALIGAEDEFGNDVLPLTQLEKCSHGITNRPSSCSIIWSFQEDLGPLIGPISKKVKFFVIGTVPFLQTRQVRNSFTIDEVIVQPFTTLPEAPKLIPNFELLGAQVSTKTGTLFSTAEVLSRFRVSAPDLFADIEYQVNSSLRDDDLPDIMILDVFTRSISRDEIDIFDNAFSDPSVFALNKPRLDVEIRIDGNLIFEALNIPLAKVEFVEPIELPPEPLPPLPEPIPDPDPVPQPGDPPLPPPPEEIPTKNNTKRNVAIAGIALVGVAAIALRR